MHYHLIPKIKNAEQAGKTTMVTPFSNVDFAIAEILVKAGYLNDVQKKAVGKKNFLEMQLLQRSKGPKINGFNIMSKPSRHMYVDYRNIKPVKQGYGIGVFSTSRGIMEGEKAKKEKIGGEYLFQIW